MSTLTREVTARELRAHLGSLVDEAAYGHGRIGLHRYGSLVAVLIGVDDFIRLQRLEDQPGALDAEESLDEWAARVIAEGRAARAAEEEARREAADHGRDRPEQGPGGPEQGPGGPEAGQHEPDEHGTARGDGPG
jgi:prevent-host-death family protein